MTPAGIAEFAADAIGFFSALALTIPAVRDNRLKRIAYQIGKTKVNSSGGFDDIQEGAKNFMANEIDRLKPVDFILIALGFALLILAYGVKLVSWLLPAH